jgi:hypothetical protein
MLSFAPNYFDKVSLIFKLFCSMVNQFLIIMVTPAPSAAARLLTKFGQKLKANDFV